MLLNIRTGYYLSFLLPLPSPSSAYFKCLVFQRNFKILQALYTDSVPEDALPGKLILQVSATDADIRSNAEITYTLHGTGAEKFGLTPDTGNSALRMIQNSSRHLILLNVLLLR